MVRLAPLVLLAALIVAWPSIASADCSGMPAVCGVTCHPDAFGTPITCSNGTCTCAPGYDTRTAADGSVVCLPLHPEDIGTESRDSGDLDDMNYSCPGICTQDSDGLTGGAVLWSPVGNSCVGGSQSGATCLTSNDCQGTCGAKTTGQCNGGQHDSLICNDPSDCPGGICVMEGFCSGHGGLCTSDADCGGTCTPQNYKPFDLVPVHGTAPGGEAFMPVWGRQAQQCGEHGLTALCSGGSKDGIACSTAADCPGGTCSPIGTCQGGSHAGDLCFSTSACLGTCGALTTGQCEGSGPNEGHTCHDDSDCPAGTCAPRGFCSGIGSLCASDADCNGYCVAGSGRCNMDGRNCGSNAGCAPGDTCTLARTWSGCTPDPFPFCFGLQDSDEGSFDYKNCESSEGHGDCGDVNPTQWGRARSGDPADLCGKSVSDFTSAWPFIDRSNICELGSIPNPIYQLGGVPDPARIDYPNNVIVYRAPTRWEEFSNNAIDHDYTMDTASPGHELHDTDTQFTYHQSCSDENHGRVHVEFDRYESVDHFTMADWGAANLWWRKLRSVTDGLCCICAANPAVCAFLGEPLCAADADACVIGNSTKDRTNATRCFLKSFVNKDADGNDLSCAPPADTDVDGDCKLHDPMVVTVGVPSLDCADDAYQGTDEIHPVLGMAIRIQEDPSKAEQWTFFYRQTGGTGPCGGQSYSRCLSTFHLPLGLPVVAGGKVLKGADVQVDWHGWKMDDTVPKDVSVGSTFDLSNGTVLHITLPHFDEGVVGLVTVTPTLDTTPPTITCPAAVTTPVDLGKCTATVIFPAPTASDDCLVSSVCSPPSGSTFPLGTTTDTCTATDQAGQNATCSFPVTVTAGNKCPQAQGYWKSHPGLWPISTLTMGGVTYTKVQALAILNNSTMGDASVVLARTEIAALLNLANGSNPTPICATIADADGALNGLRVPAAIGPKTTLGQRMVKDSVTLDSYDNGKLTPGCMP